MTEETRWVPKISRPLCHLACSSALILLAVSPAARGFSKQEHFQLSNLALHVAVGVACASDPAPAICAEARNLLLSSCATSDCVAEKKRLWFGSYTRAADFFTHTGRMISDPLACHRREVGECNSTDLIRLCSRDLGAACVEAVDQEGDDRIRRRQSFKRSLSRWTAAHRNRNHFRQFAQERYEELHERARRLESEGHLRLALKTEAVALHFLHDLFAPGHLASPRADFDDVAAGWMHDRFNRKGLRFGLRPSSNWTPLIAALETVVDGAQPASLYKHSIALTDEDVRLFASQVGPDTAEDCDTLPLYIAKGDKRLLDRKGLDNHGRTHRTMLVLASAASIGQILKGSASGPRLCFQPQLADPERPTTEFRPASATMVWPTADEAIAGAHLPPGFCSLDRPGTIAGYETRVDNLNSAFGGAAPRSDLRALKTLGKFNPRTSAFEVAAAAISRNGGGNRFQLDWNFISLFPDSEVYELDPETGGVSKDPVEPPGKGIQNTWSLSLMREEMAGFDGTGLGITVMMPRRFKSDEGGHLGNFTAFFAAELGAARYANDARTTDRWRGALRVGLGLDMLLFELGAERGASLDPFGTIDRQWRYFGGIRTRISSSWISAVRFR